MSKTVKREKATKTTTVRRARSPQSNGLPIIIRGYSIGAIARGIGKSGGYISRCLRSQRRPSVQTLEALKVFLQLDSLDAAASLFAREATAAGALDVQEAANPAADDARRPRPGLCVSS